MLLSGFSLFRVNQKFDHSLAGNYKKGPHTYKVVTKCEKQKFKLTFDPKDQFKVKDKNKCKKRALILEDDKGKGETLNTLNSLQKLRRAESMYFHFCFTQKFTDTVVRSPLKVFPSKTHNPSWSFLMARRDQWDSSVWSVLFAKALL